MRRGVWPGNRGMLGNVVIRSRTAWLSLVVSSPARRASRAASGSLLGHLARVRRGVLPAFHDGRQELVQWLLKRSPIAIAEGELDRVAEAPVSDGTGSLTDRTLRPRPLRPSPLAA